MDLTQIILGPVVTEKAERGKEHHTWTLKVAPQATKVDIKRALKRFYDVDVLQVRIQRVRPKERMVGGGRIVTRRHAWKKALVTLGSDSKALDLIQFKTLS